MTYQFSSLELGWRLPCSLPARFSLLTDFSVPDHFLLASGPDIISFGTLNDESHLHCVNEIMDGLIWFSGFRCHFRTRENQIEIHGYKFGASHMALRDLLISVTLHDLLQLEVLRHL